MNFIQLNKFSELHDGKKIFFCKTDFVFEEFRKIKNLSNDVILVTGNSDFPITDNYLNIMPKNIVKWYGQNILSNEEIFEPIPLGLENKFDSRRDGHGISYYERVSEKENLLERNIDINPTKKIYANFRVDTNFSHRNVIKNICVKSQHIDWNEPNLTLKQFFDTILDYEMVVCPAGNGVDTHRLWEVLYSKRVPITIKVGNYKIYNLYENFPIIILDSVDDLNNLPLIEEKYKAILKKQFNMDLLNCNKWIDLIKENFK